MGLGTNGKDIREKKSAAGWVRAPKPTVGLDRIANAKLFARDRFNCLPSSEQKTRSYCD